MASTVAAWPTVRFDQILQRVERKIMLEEGASYDCAGVRWYGNGAFRRESLLGMDIARKQQWILRAGDIVYNKLFAWKGAFAIADASVDGCIVSDKFPTYSADPALVDPAFLGYYFRTPQIAKQAEDMSKGAAAISKLTLNPPQFWDLAIPLPPLEEQRRIVGRIAALAARIEQARALRRATAEEAEGLLGSYEEEVWPSTSLNGSPSLEDVTVHLSRGRQSQQGESPHRLIKTQHVQQGRYVRSHLTLAPEAAEKVAADSLVRQGDILIACSAAGCLGRVAQFLDDSYKASTDTHVAIARADQKVILPEYLYAYLKSSRGQFQLRSRERGDWQREKVGFRLTELNLADLKGVPVPCPPMDEQQRILAHLDKVQAKVDTLHRFQSESAAELDVLLPSVLDRAFRGEL